MRKISHILFCKKSCWVKADQKTLVHAGDPEAAYLVAIAGQSFPAEEITKYPDHDSFFQDDEFIPEPPKPPDLTKVGGPSVVILKSGQVAKPVEMGHGSQVTEVEKEKEPADLNEAIRRDATQLPPEDKK